MSSAWARRRRSLHETVGGAPRRSGRVVRLTGHGSGRLVELPRRRRCWSCSGGALRQEARPAVAQARRSARLMPPSSEGAAEGMGSHRLRRARARSTCTKGIVPAPPRPRRLHSCVPKPRSAHVLHVARTGRRVAHAAARLHLHAPCACGLRAASVHPRDRMARLPSRTSLPAPPEPSPGHAHLRNP